MDERIWVVATISLPGLPLGREALVDPSDSYMKDCLAHGYLQRLPEAAPVAEEPATDEPETVADPADDGG